MCERVLELSVYIWSLSLKGQFFQDESQICDKKVGGSFLGWGRSFESKGEIFLWHFLQFFMWLTGPGQLLSLCRPFWIFRPTSTQKIVLSQLKTWDLQHVACANKSSSFHDVMTLTVESGQLKNLLKMCGWKYCLWCHYDPTWRASMRQKIQQCTFRTTLSSKSNDFEICLNSIFITTDLILDPSLSFLIKQSRDNYNKEYCFDIEYCAVV